MLEKIASAPTRLKSFYFDVKRELRKVTWPGRNEVYGTTAVVLISVFFFGFYLFLVDMVLSNLVDRVFEFFR
ncbi:MAG: preprotein translocase subunit SecE [Candidatus Aminicenantes bacterium]|nr:preprotein translocase subunit SecE [Candidatus Aminicenantes bacterium]